MLCSSGQQCVFPLERAWPRSSTLPTPRDAPNSVILLYSFPHSVRGSLRSLRRHSSSPNPRCSEGLNPPPAKRRASGRGFPTSLVFPLFLGRLRNTCQFVSVSPLPSMPRSVRNLRGMSKRPSPSLWLVRLSLRILTALRPLVSPINP